MFFEKVIELENLEIGMIVRNIYFSTVMKNNILPKVGDPYLIFYSSIFFIPSKNGPYYLLLKYDYFTSHHCLNQTLFQTTNGGITIIYIKKKYQLQHASANFFCQACKTEVALSLFQPIW